MNVPKKALSLILSFALVAGTAISSGAFAETARGELPEAAAEGTPETNNVAEVGGISYPTLTEAISAAQDGKTVKLLKDISRTSRVELTHPVTLDGNGHKLTFSGLDSQGNDVNDGLVIEADGITVKNLTVDAGLENPGTWVGTYAIQAFSAGNATLENVTATGGNGGILVNGSTVTLKGRIDVSGNGTGGINVSKEDDAKYAPKLDATGATLVNDTQTYTNPTIWVDGVSAEAAGTTVKASGLDLDEKTKDSVYAYFLKVASIESTPYPSLADAISAADDDQTVKLLKDVSRTSRVELTHPVTIDGNGHKLTFSGLDSQGNDVNDGLVIEADDITVKNLTVDAGLTNKTNWVGTYAIQAFSAGNATLENVTATGGNGGILVNGSTVTLKGRIDVSGNGCGGINVSKEADAKNDPELDATDAKLVNTTEAMENPTIWEDNVPEDEDASAVTAPNLYRIDSDDPLLHIYYLDVKNTGEPYFTLSNVPQTVQAETQVTEETNGKVSTFDTTGRTPINVTLHKGAADYPNVRVVVDVKKNNEVTNNIQLLAKDTNKVWWNIAKTGWGPANGFELAEATTPVYLVASEPGTYTATIQLVNVAEGANTVLAETTAKVTAVETVTPVQFAPKEPEVSVPDSITDSSKVSDALADTEPGEDLNVLAQQKAIERFENGKTSKDDQDKINEAKGLVANEDQDIVVVVAQPYLDITAKAYTAGADNTAGTLTLDITPKCKLVATSKQIADSLNGEDPTELKTGENEEDRNGVEISDTAIDVPSGSDVTLTIPLPSGFITAGGLQIKHVKANGNVYYYPATVTPATENAPATATFTVTHGFSDFTLQAADTRTLTVNYDSGVAGATYSITDVGGALPGASKSGYDFNGWKFGSDTEAYTTLTDALWDELMGEAQADQTVTATAQFTKKSSGNPGGTPVVPEQPEEPETTYKSDTTYDLTVNGAYTFLITSLNGKAPSFAVGTPGVFRTELVRQDGNKYYYKITSVGKAGSQAGIYINGGSRLLIATVGKPAATYKSDTTYDLTVNGAYTFLITSLNGKKPSFAVGTPGVFRTELVRQSGNNYYYKITSVGKKGAQAGIYLNGGSRLLIATVK